MSKPTPKAQNNYNNEDYNNEDYNNNSNYNNNGNYNNSTPQSRRTPAQSTPQSRRTPAPRQSTPQRTPQRTPQITNLQGNKPRRSPEYMMNVQGLFQPKHITTNTNFKEHAASLVEKYKSNPQILKRIENARKLRNSGVTIGQRKEKMTKIPKEQAKKTGPKALCEDDISGNPFTKQCWAEGIKKQMDPILRNISKGEWQCKKDPALGPHQVVAFEAAKLMAANPNIGPDDRRGLMVFHNTGSGKCWKYDTPILMYDGSVKKVQDVSVGDEVMGDDSTPRRVLGLGRGKEPMYDIVPSKKNAETWGCNASHILVLKYLLHKKITLTKEKTLCVRYHDGSGGFRCKNFKTAAMAATFAEGIPDDHGTVHMEVRDYLLLKDHVKHVLKLYKTGVEFDGAEEPCFDPYVLGAWLGDGTSRSTNFCICEPPLVDELQRRLDVYDMELAPSKVAYAAPMYNAKSRSTSGQVGGNPLRNALMEHGMMGKDAKHVPHHIKTGTRDVRLQVLAGLLDTDGFYANGCYDIIQKNKVLADDIVFIARSLGFAAYVTPCRKGCRHKGEYREATYFRVSISGAGLEEIPVVLERKRAAPRKQIKDALHYGFTVVAKGEGDYYGFTVDGNHRLLLGDFTVSHNTVTAMGIMAAFWASKRKIFFVTSLENQKNNPLSEYARNALIFFPKYANIIFEKAAFMPPSDLWTVKHYREETPFPDPDGTMTNFKEWCTKQGAPVIAKRIVNGKIISFQVFAGATKKMDTLMTEPCLVIIDESQNMFKPRGQDGAAESNALKYMAKNLPTEAFMKNSVVFPLTATPGDTADQVVQMVNVVRPWGMPAFTAQEFVDNPRIARGLISYADIRGDKTHYGILAGNKPINKYIPFTSEYFAAFLAEMSGYMKTDATNLNTNPSESKKFFIKAMMGGCMLPIKKVEPFYKGNEGALEKMVKGKGGRGAYQVFSSKMVTIFETIKKTHGCQYLYVPTPTILQAVIDVLQTTYGFERLTDKTGDGTDRHKYLTRGSGGSWKMETPKVEKPRFYSFYPKVLDGVAGDANQMKAVLDFFKSGKNKAGQHIKLFVGTVFEGLDMGWLQAVHLATPLPSTADDDQAVGRALRYCGHNQAAKTVSVYRYFGMAPEKLDIDGPTATKQRSIDSGLEMLVNFDARGINAHVFRNAQRRGLPMEKFMMCLRSQSIECEANAQHGGLLAAVQYGIPTNCGIKKCDVAMVDGKLVVPPPGPPGKHSNGLLHQTLHNYASGKKPTGKPTKNKLTSSLSSFIGKPTGSKPAGSKPSGSKPSGSKPSGSKPAKTTHYPAGSSSSHPASHSRPHNNAVAAHHHHTGQSTPTSSRKRAHSPTNTSNWNSQTSVPFGLFRRLFTSSPRKKGKVVS